MRPNVWMKARDCEPSEDGCESGACVEVAVTSGGTMLVRDSKLGEASPVLTYTPQRWEEDLVDRIMAEEVIDWVRELHPLDFDAQEIAAFVAAVRSGDFKLVLA